MRRTTLRLAALPLLALAAAACASSSAEPASFAPAAAVAGAMRVDAIAAPDEARALLFTIYPTPRVVEYGTSLLPLAGALQVDDASPDFDERLRAAGLESGWKELPREGYVLCVAAENGRAVVLKAAHDDAGKRWAEQALAQVSLESGSRRFVRECRVLDAPVFRLRGSKRPQAWETRYRANFAWGARDDADTRGRTMAAVYAPGIPLDASGAGVARALEFFRPWQERGVRLCAVKFDDESFAVTADSELRYGRFAPALVGYLKLLRQGLRRRDPDAHLYLLPQTYWWNDDRLEPFASAIRTAGGLDEDVGLVFTGPEVISREIDAEGLATARRAFGATETRALLYDNLGREGDWGPLTGRDPRLAQICDGVFGERGTPVHRLTRLDWLWNPSGYDPERSWRRAMLELAGPQGYTRLAAVCAAFRRGASQADVGPLVDALATASGPWKGSLPREDLVALLRGDVERIGAPDAAPSRPTTRP